MLKEFHYIFQRTSHQDKEINICKSQTYSCVSASLTLTKEQILGVFENKVLREVSGPNLDEIIELFRILQNGEFHCVGPVGLLQIN